MQQPPRPANSPLLDPPSMRFVVGAGTLKALLALGLLWLVPRLGHDVDAARAVAFHFMAIGQLLLTFPARHTWTHPLPNRYLHAAVGLGVLIQLTAAWLPLTSQLLGHASLPLPLWVLVFGAAIASWACAEGVARLVWRQAR